MLKWPMIKNERVERGCKMRARDPGGGSRYTVHDGDCQVEGNWSGSMKILYNL